MGDTEGAGRATPDGTGQVTVRLFGVLHAMRRAAGLRTTLAVDVPAEGIPARALAQELDLPVDRIEGVFCNGDVFGLSRILRPGDRVAFVPYGTPGPHRFYLGLYDAGHEDDDETVSREEE
jgi:hypothetical protein